MDYRIPAGLALTGLAYSQADEDDPLKRRMRPYARGLGSTMPLLGQGLEQQSGVLNAITRRLFPFG